MNKKIFIINNIANIRDNYIADYINKYIKNGNFYDLGWGNLNKEMVRHSVPQIDFDKKVIGCYNNSQGTNDLINEIIKFVRKKSGLKLEIENVLVTNGATNAIFLLSCFFKSFLGINKVLLQNPTYDTAINIFKSQKYDIETTNPNLDKINDRNIKLAYLMFKFQNPTGAYIEKDSNKEFKNKLLKNSYLIEDDSYGLLENNSEINIINNKKYLYVSSFSKYIFPGLRMGYIVAYKDVIYKLKIIQKYYNSHPNILSQLILLDYLRTDKIYDEIENKIKILDARRNLFENSLSLKIKDLIQYNKGGFYYWFKLPNNINLSQLFIELLRNKILVIPGDIYFLNDKYNAIRVSISSISNTEVPAAAIRFSNIIEKHV